MELVQKMKRALQKARSDSLPEDPNEAAHVLLPYVVQNQIRPVIDLLTNSTYDVNFKFGRAQRTLLHSAANTGAFDSLMFLLKRGAQVNVIDRIGITPLHLAARNGHKKCVQKLVESGADIGIHDNEGLTALHWLACNGRTELLTIILQKGEYVDVVDIHGHTALHVSCQNGHIQCVKKLLEFKASLNQPNGDGRTPLFFACRHGQLKCVKFLLDKGAEIIPDNNGVTLMDICAESGYKECIELILLKYPDQVDKLVCLIKQEQISLSNMQLILEYLCNVNTGLMVAIISRLATLTSMAGMELMSISSSYQDLMPQFLRCVKILCSLYPFYKQAVPLFPASPKTLPSSPSPPSPSAVSKRADSIGSPLDANRFHSSRNRSFLNSWTAGHRRTGSTPNELEETVPLRTGSSSVSLESGDLLQDPFELLEVVWKSLESWFDLLVKEIHRLSEMKMKDSEQDASAKEQQLKPDDSSSDTSQLAAAIILSAPPERREVFLKPSVSFERPTGIIDKEARRRSWHTDRVVRVVPLGLEEDVSSVSLLPSYCRSKSTETSPKDGPVAQDTPISGVEVPIAPPQSPEDAWNPDIVGAYAERLAAVTHAFSICCSVMQKSCGSRTDDLLPRFKSFVNKYDPVFKVLLARNPQLIFAHFHFLLESTELLSRFIHIVHAQPFDQRKKWFYENLYGDKPPEQQFTLRSQDQEIVIDREKLFRSSCEKITDAPIEKLKESLVIRFEGEAGMGTGVYREWFDSLSSEILNPDYALFTQSSDGATFQPNSHSDVNPDHLSYFRFAGRSMALALYHQQLLNVYFTRSFYKHILGIPVSYRDVESIDPEYANNLQWLLDNNIDALDLGLTFSVQTDVFGATELIELTTDGSQITVTDDNKAEYVQLVTEMRMTQAIGTQIKAFTDGFYEIVPHHLISLFNEYELELLMSGLPDISVSDWEKNTEYTGYSPEHQTIKWFWEVVHEYDKKQLVVLLQFVTGSSRVPLGGFANLVGASGITKFTISHLEYRPNRLPMASTCFNLLKLPEYDRKEVLKERLELALTCGTGLIDIT